jgi:hypothetical protein
MSASPRTLLRVLGAAAISTALTMGPAARAQDANQERIAEALFQEGRALMKAGKFSEACPKFEASQKASPSTGTELNLADCLEKSGATASAWALYLAVARAAAKENRKDRETIAKTKVAALEPRLSHMKIVAPAGVDVKRNGTLVEPALLGTDEPIDPGPYTIEVSAKGKKTWSQTVTVQAAAGGHAPEPVVVTVPELPVDTTAPPPTPATVPPETPPPPAPIPASPPPEAKGGMSTLRIVGLVTGGVGVVGLGVGSAFGFIAMSKQSSAGCPKNVCPNAADEQTIRNAESAGTISTVAFIVGGALAATGIVLFAIAPKSASTTAASLRLAPAVGPGGIGVDLGGSF